MDKNVTKVAMDTHKKQHAVAMVELETGQISVFSVNNTIKDLKKMVGKIQKRSPGQIHVCYEAGVCGFVLKRQLEALGCQCDVIAPSLVPTKPGDRVKTDRPEYREIVGLLRCFRGIDTLTAITVLTEIFEFGRFDSPRPLMSYLGLVPSEYSSGENSQRGGITKAGNKRVRRLLVESAWHYRHRPWASKDLNRRRKDQPQWAIDMADKAMSRLYKRYWHLIKRGKMPTKVSVALSRELAGFIWALLHEHRNRQGRQSA